jgi:putative ABC transport system permease protein
MIWESVTIALRGLTANKLRTALTMLGIIIGVAAVISLLSIGKGFEASFNRDIESMGTNVLWILPGNFDIFGEGGGESSRQVDRRNKEPQPLTTGDAQAIGNPVSVPDVVAIAPTFEGSPRSVIRGQTEMVDSPIIGTTPEFEPVRNVTLNMGTFISQMDVDQRARVAVIGSKVAEELFELYENPLGQTIKLNGVPFEVIGVLEEKSRGLFGDENSNVLIPLSTAQTRLYRADTFRGNLVVSAIYAQVGNRGSMDVAVEDITSTLRRQHRLKPD